MIKKLLTTCLIFSIFASTQIAFADEDRMTEFDDQDEYYDEYESPDDSEGLVEEVSDEISDAVDTVSKVTCLGGFTKFLSSVIDLDNFGVYYKDLFSRNMCYLQDSFALEDEMDAIQEELRDSYYSCDYSNVAQLENEYKMKKAELYFIRNAVKFKSETLTDEKIEEMKIELENELEKRLSDEEEAEKTYVSSYFSFDKLQQDMEEKYVEDKGWFGEDEFPDYFNGWISEYSDNLLTYLDCDYGSWSEVEEKKDELIETWTSAMEAFRSLRGEKNEENDSNEEEEESGDPSAKDSVWTKLGEYFDDHLKRNYSYVDDVPDNLSNLFNGDSSQDEEYSSTTSTTSFSAVYDAYTSEIERYNTESLEAELMAKYETLYGEGGASITKDLENLLKDLQELLTNSDTHAIPASAGYTKTVAKKQCRS